MLVGSVPGRPTGGRHGMVFAPHRPHHSTPRLPGTLTPHHTTHLLSIHLNTSLKYMVESKWIITFHGDQSKSYSDFSIGVTAAFLYTHFNNVVCINVFNKLLVLLCYFNIISVKDLCGWSYNFMECFYLLIGYLLFMLHQWCLNVPLSTTNSIRCCVFYYFVVNSHIIMSAVYCFESMFDSCDIRGWSDFVVKMAALFNRS